MGLFVTVSKIEEDLGVQTQKLLLLQNFLLQSMCSRQKFALSIPSEPTHSDAKSAVIRSWFPWLFQRISENELKGLSFVATA